LFIREIQEHFVGQVKHLWLLFLLEGKVKILPCQSGDFRRWIEEATVPNREDLLDVGAEFALTLLHKGLKSFVGGLSDELIVLVHQDPAHVIQIKGQDVRKFLGRSVQLIYVARQLSACLDLGY
jgi:hypothetical protein